MQTKKNVRGEKLDEAKFGIKGKHIYNILYTHSPTTNNNKNKRKKNRCENDNDVEKLPQIIGTQNKIM